jgi:hypothetical protein
MKFSQLRQGEYIEHNGEIITQSAALELIRTGEQITEFKTVTPEFKQSVLKQSFRDFLELVDSESVTAINDGEIIEIDVSI